MVFCAMHSITKERVICAATQLIKTFFYCKIYIFLYYVVCQLILKLAIKAFSSSVIQSLTFYMLVKRLTIMFETKSSGRQSCIAGIA